MATRKAFQRNLRDADLIVSRVLPGGASTTVASAAIDLGALSNGASSRPDGLELVFTTPLLSITQLPDTRTLTISIEESDDPAFGSYNTIKSKVITGTTANSGAPADEVRTAVASNTLRYVRAKAVTGASTGDQSAATGQFAVVA